MTRARSIPALAASALALCTLSGAASSQDAARRVLLDASLTPRVVDVIALDDTGVTVIGPGDKPLVYDIAQIVALAPMGTWHDAGNDPTLTRRGALTTRTGLLVLTDGQRLTGAPTGIDTGDETIAWSNARLGGVRVPLEYVDRLHMPRIIDSDNIPEPLTNGLDDFVLLNNGDRLVGFVESIGNQTRIEPLTGGALSLDSSSIDQISLATDPAEASGTVVWLGDGSVVSLESYETAQMNEQIAVLGTLAPGPIASPSGERTPSEADDRSLALQMDFPLESVRAVSFAAGSLVPISSLESVGEGPGIRVDHAGAAALGARDILLPGPMRVTWTLPERTRRIALTASLPIESRAWGDFELIVFLDDHEVARQTINAVNPSVDLAFDARGERSLTIEIEEGAFGPIQDRIVISRGLVLTDR